MALQPQIVMGNGALTTRRYMEIAAATTSFKVRIANSDDAPLPPPADFDPNFGSQVNKTMYETVMNAVLFFANINDETLVNAAVIPSLFLSFFNKGGDFYLNMFGLQSCPYRLFDPFFPSPSGPITWQGLEFETRAAGLAPRYFDIILSREASVSNITLTLDIVLPHTVLQ